MDISTVAAALLSTFSGVWAISAFRDLDFTWRDFLRGRQDVFILWFVVTTTGVSAWHTIMMAVWAAMPGGAVTSSAFVIEIGFWNIAASLAFVFGHVIAKQSYRTANKRLMRRIYLFPWGGGPARI